MEAIQSTIDSILSSLKEEKFISEQTLADASKGISLLELKNEALLSYIANLLLLSASQLERNENVFNDSRKATIEQRVTLEKGVKGLEAKIGYQVDKVLRAYRRSLDDAETGSENAKLAARKARGEQKAADKAELQELEDEEKAEAESDGSSDSDFDATSFRPNLSGIATTRGTKSNVYGKDKNDKEETYVPPKISANMPAFEKEKRAAPRQRDFAMEEYIRETGDAPLTEASVGSKIMDHGRGGELTRSEIRKNKEIQDYEESNFTRISTTSSKRARKDAHKRQRDAMTKKFFGEDWGFLDNHDDSRKRRKK